MASQVDERSGQLRRLRALAVLVTAGAVAMFGSMVPAGADPTGRVHLVRGQGSDTTWFMMQDLDNLYNNAPGCDAIGTTKPTDLSCTNGSVPPSEPHEN